MKKHYKLLAVFVAVVLVVCCCCLSVSAASTESPINDAVVVDGNTKFHLQVAGPYDSYWTRGVFIPEPMSGTMHLCTNANVTLDHSNVFKWNAFTFSLWNKSGGASSISNISLVLLDDNYNVVATLYERAYSYTDFWQDHFDIPGGSYTTISAIDVKYIALSFDFSTLNQGLLYYYFNGYSFGYSVIDTATAEQEKTNEYLEDITADKYAPPSGGDDINNYSNAEGQLMDSAQGGLDEAGAIFSNFSLEQFASSLLGVISVVNVFVNGMPWLSELIIISLALGLFAFLFNIGRIAVREGRSSGHKKGE